MSSSVHTARMWPLYAGRAIADIGFVTDRDPENTRRGTQRRAVIARYMEERRARPAIRPMPSASRAVNRIMRPLSKTRTRGSSALALSDVWGTIMGPRWSKVSTPIRFQGGKDGRWLVIGAQRGLAPFIIAAQDQILDRLNAHLGTGSVVGIKVVQSQPKIAPQAKPKRGLSPSENAQLQAGLSDIKSERLRSALERLGREVIRDE